MNIVLASLVLALALGITTVGSATEVSINANLGAPPPPAIVLPAPPPLVIVPGVPAVRYAPSTSLDLFFHENRWYYSHGGYWYAGPSYKGPWTVIPRLPAAIVAVPVKYYKVPPGHLKQLNRGGPPGHAKDKGRGKGKGKD